MNYTEDQQAALNDLRKAMDDIKKCPSGKAGESAENRYAELYKKCYRMGLVQYPLTVCRATR